MRALAGMKLQLLNGGGLSDAALCLVGVAQALYLEPLRIQVRRTPHAFDQATLAAQQIAQEWCAPCRLVRLASTHARPRGARMHPFKSV